MPPPDKSPARIAAMFEAIAARYDFLNHFLSAGLDRRWRARTVRELQLAPGAIAFGIRNVNQPERAFGELARVLKPGARLAILEFGEPTAPGLRGLYKWYFRAVLPRVGRLVSKHESAYSYLPASVGAFPSPVE